MRRDMLVNYFEGLIMNMNCPVCGRANCTDHRDYDTTYVQMADLDEEEQSEVSRICDIIKNKMWRIQHDVLLISEQSRRSFIQYLDKNNSTGEEEWVSIELGGNKEHECKNPNCKCGGKCKVCKCELETQPLDYKLVGPYVDLLTDGEKKNIKAMLENLNVTKDSPVCIEMNGSKERGALVPFLMAKSRAMDFYLNTGITLESISDRKRGL